MADRVKHLNRSLDESTQRRPAGLPVAAWLYLVTVQLAGIALLGYSIHQAWEQFDPRWLYLSILATLASLFSVKVSDSGKRSGSVAVSAGDFFIFAAIVLVGPAAGALMGALEGLISSFRLRVRHWRKVLFNVSQLVLSAYFAGSFYHWLQPLPGDSSAEGLRALLVAVLLCALLYFLANATLVGLAMMLASRESASHMVRRGFFWALPANCVNACLVAIALALTYPMDAWLVAALVPLIIVAYVLRGAHQTSANLGTESGMAQSSGLLQVRFFEVALPMRARGYLYVVLALALPILFYSVHYSFTLAPMNWLYLAVLAAAASCFPLQLLAVREKIWLTLSDLFVFVALFQYGAEVAVVIAAVEALAFNLRHRPKGPYRWTFNVTQLVVTAFAVGQFFRLLDGLAGVDHSTQLGVSRLMLALSTPMICGFLYYLSTLALTAGAMTLVTGQSFRLLWQKNVGWCYPSVLGALAGASAYLLIQGFSLGL